MKGLDRVRSLLYELEVVCYKNIYKVSVYAQTLKHFKTKKSYVGRWRVQIRRLLHVLLLLCRQIYDDILQYVSDSVLYYSVTFLEIKYCLLVF